MRRATPKLHTPHTISNTLSLAKNLLLSFPKHTTLRLSQHRIRAGSRPAPPHPCSALQKNTRQTVNIAFVRKKAVNMRASKFLFTSRQPYRTNDWHMRSLRSRPLARLTSTAYQPPRQPKSTP